MIICDRCGATFDVDIPLKDNRIYANISLIGIKNNEYFTLCEKCIADLREFLKH